MLSIGCIQINSVINRLWLVTNTASKTYISVTVDGEASGTKNQSQNTDLRRQVNTDSSLVPVESGINDSYPMNNENRGKCIIFSHQEVDHPDLDKRKNADEEAQLIKETFQKLGFEITICMDFSHRKIKSKLAQLARQNYEKDDCICIFILTHGDARGLLWAKDVAYPIGIFEETLSNIESLKNKPKLMFVQACRGDRVDKGVALTRQSSSSSSGDETDFRSTSNKIPSRADFFIAQSTPPGYYSWRGWFIPVLCKNFNKYSEVADLDAIMTKTTDEVCRYESVYDKEVKKDKAKQAPYVEKTLRKKLYLKR